MLVKIKSQFNLSTHNVQVSLEQRMGCGIGSCLGCVIKKAGSQEYLKVCKDGPIFSLAEVDFE